MFFRKLFNRLGFSLVEVMVVAALLGGVSLVVMNLTKQSEKSSSKYQFDTEVMLITNEINGILSDPNKCLTTFTNATQGAYPSQPVLAASPANVLNPTGIAGIPSTDRKYTLAGGPYGNGRLKINSYTLDLNASPDPLLIINYKKSNILGGGNISKTIRMAVTKNGSGVITQCRTLATASAEIWSRGNGTDIFYAGNVGIGTSTPNSNLHVQGWNPDLNVENTNALMGGSSSVTFGHSQGGNTTPMARIYSYLIDGSSSRAGDLRIQTSTNGALNDRMAILANGNVGVGTTAPKAKLDVAGEIKLGNTSSTCDATTEGQQRYNSTSKNMEFCNGTVWSSFGGTIINGYTLQISGYIGVTFMGIGTYNSSSGTFTGNIMCTSGGCGAAGFIGCGSSASCAWNARPGTQSCFNGGCSPIAGVSNLSVTSVTKQW